jgi:hypothetical protein
MVDEHTGCAERPLRRGRALAAAAALVVTVAGCGTPAGTGPTPSPPSSAGGTAGPAETTSPTPTATLRSVTANNLLVPDQIPIDDPTYQTVVEAPEGTGRTVQQSYICLPADGLASLGATAMVIRSFAYRIDDPQADPYPDSPLKGQPVIFTQALQFADQAAATKARKTYVGWVMRCPAQLDEKGYTVDKDYGFAPTKVDVENARAEVGMVAYIKPGDSDAETFYFESAGVTQVKDRLMLTISLSYSMDSPGTLDDTDGDFIHPQLILVEESAVQLAR